VSLLDSTTTKYKRDHNQKIGRQMKCTILDSKRDFPRKRGRNEKIEEKEEKRACTFEGYGNDWEPRHKRKV